MVFFWIEYLNPANCHLRAECEWTERPRFPRGYFVDGTVIRCGKKKRWWVVSFPEPPWPAAGMVQTRARG